MPGFDQWIKDVQAMPAEKQVEAEVGKKLMELNPGFEGKLTETSWSGTRLYKMRTAWLWGFHSTDKVTDISPVRALSQLERLLECERRDLADLSPLKE